MPFRSFFIFISFTFAITFAQDTHKNYIISDDFDNNAQKWFLQKKENINYILENGLYKIEIYDSLPWNYTKSYVEQDPDHYFVDFEFKKSVGNKIGVMFSGKDNSNAYIFRWKSNKTFELLKYIDSKETPMIEKNWPDKIKEVKTVGISVRHKFLTIYVNEIPIVEEQSIEPMGKSFGFTVFKGSLHVTKVSLGNWTTDIELLDDWELFANPQRLPDHINSPFVELVPVISADGNELYYTRRDDPGNFGTEGKDDIFHTYKLENGTWSEGKRLGRPLNNKDANYVCSIADGGKTLLLGNKYMPDSSCKLGVSTTKWNGKEWEFPKSLNIKNFYNESKNQEFFLSSDGKVLLMTLQRKDSKGLKDLYVSFLIKDRTWTEPKNMGEVLNTSANELSPFLSPDGNKLYFSSFGHPGYGSADIFVSEKLDDTYLNWSKPKNLGPKINSIGFDAYFSTTEDLSTAYLIKTSPKTRQDIYEITLKPKELIGNDIKIFGYTRSENEKNDLSLEIKIKQGEEVKKIKSEKNGYFEFIAKRDKTVEFEIEQTGYFNLSESLDPSIYPHFKEKRKDLILIPIEKGSSLVLNNIIFHQGTPKIVETSFPALDEIFNIMVKYPTLEAELWGHTEKLGDENLNVGLSERRAMEIKKYIVGKG
ncbi:MAG: hypothetical protein SNJ77_06835, partial [Cytophagales bacterium]